MHSYLEKHLYSGVIFNSLLVLYMLFAHQWFFTQSYESIFNQGQNWVFGLVILIVQVLEFFFLVKKLSHVTVQLGDKKPAFKKHPGFLITIIFAHFMISFLMMEVMFSAFGLNGELSIAIAGSISTIKELILWFRVGIQLDNPRPLTKKQNFIADASLLGYSGMAYTLSWEPFASNTSLLSDWGNPVIFYPNALIMLVITGLLLLPLRLPYLLQEWSGKKSTFDKAILLSSFALLLAGAFLPTLDGELSLEKAIADKTHIRQLFLSNQGLTEVPPEIWEMHELIKLDLGHNQIKSIPAAIRQLQKLEILQLQNNPLESIADELTELPNLRELDLRNTRLPPGSSLKGRLKKIKVLL